MVVHKLIFAEHPLFINIGDKYFISWVSNNLKASTIIQSQYMYTEDDEIDGFYFLKKGLAAFILPKMSGMIYAVLDPEEQLSKSTKRKMQTFQYFGCEDSVYNHLKLIIDEKNGKETKIYKGGDQLLNRRKYTVQCIKQTECLTLSMAALDKMKKEF